MNIVVTIKQVPDTEASIAPQDNGIDETAVNKWILNPYDEHAVEEAVRLKETVNDSQVVAISLGPARVKSAFHTAFAMGVDRGIHIVTDPLFDPAQTAEALATVIRQEGLPDVVFAGVLAIDDYASQVPLRLAHRLEASVATDVSSFTWKEQGAEVTRETGGAQERIFLPIPAVVAVTRSINKPRYPTLPNIMKAKKKEIRPLTPEQVGLTPESSSMTVTGINLPEEQAQGKILENENDRAVPELIHLLQSEAKVI